MSDSSFIHSAVCAAQGASKDQKNWTRFMSGPLVWSVTLCVQTLALWASSALCIHDVKWICDLLVLVASISVCCLLCFLTALMLSGEAVLLFASPLFVFQNWINYWWSKMKKMKRKKWRKKKKKKERERKRESVLRIKCRTFFQFCFLTKDSRHLEPLRFISREHCPMMSESATYYQVLFCR